MNIIGTVITCGIAIGILVGGSGKIGVDTNSVDTAIRLDSKTESTSSTKENKAKESENKTDKIKYLTYKNARFGYSINYPSNFQKGREADNGDGLEFTSGDCNITVFGSNNIFLHDGESYFDEYVKPDIKGKVDYKKITKKMVVVSYIDSGMIYYSKRIIGEFAINGFDITYPENESDKYNKIVEDIEKSFKAPYVNSEIGF